MIPIKKSDKLSGVCYDIRGPVLEHANRLEEEGQRILKLNIGNPAPFGFAAPDEILQDVIRNVHNAEGYNDSKGLFAARKAIMHECQRLYIEVVVSHIIFLGTGCSVLIVMAMQALLNSNADILVPAAVYPHWAAAVILAGDKARHCLCDEQADWFPDLAEIESKV